MANICIYQGSLSLIFSALFFHKLLDTTVQYSTKMRCGENYADKKGRQKYVFVPLDIFMKCHQNKNIENLQDAWLTFLVTEDPDQIIELIETYPKFKKMYGEIYAMCENMGDIMNSFSEGLYILDRNTE